MENTDLSALTPTELLSTLDSAWTAGNRALARMLAYLGEVERRGLHKEMSCSSMFVFLERRFGLTGGTAFRRLTAARLVRRFPRLMRHIEHGDIHLEALCLLRDVLSKENFDELMTSAANKTLREVEGIVACLAPRPDVKGTIRKLPERAQPIDPPPSHSAASESDTPTALSLFAMRSEHSELAPSPSDCVAPTLVESAPVAPVAPVALAPVSLESTAIAPSIAPRPEAPRPRMQQLSAARHKVQLTVSSETRAKIERAQALMKHRNPSGDLEVLFDRAMDALIAKLEKERLGKTSRPQKKKRPSKDGHIPADTRRQVFERDGEQCAHVDEHGNRCGCRDFLEIDHVKPRALGGTDDLWNLRVVCRAHNQLYAEQAFGKDYVAAKIEAHREAKRRKRAAGGASALPNRK